MLNETVEAVANWGVLVVCGAALGVLGFALLMAQGALSLVGRLFGGLAGREDPGDTQRVGGIMDGGCWWDDGK